MKTELILIQVFGDRLKSEKQNNIDTNVGTISKTLKNNMKTDIIWIQVLSDWLKSGK